VNVRLDTPQSAAKVYLGVAVITIVGLAGKPPINVVAIANQKSACVGDVVLYAVAIAVFGEKNLCPGR
jgi:hypothetical protein